MVNKTRLYSAICWVALPLQSSQLGPSLQELWGAAATMFTDSPSHVYPALYQCYNKVALNLYMQKSVQAFGAAQNLAHLEQEQDSISVFAKASRVQGLIGKIYAIFPDPAPTEQRVRELIGSVADDAAKPTLFGRIANVLAAVYRANGVDESEVETAIGLPTGACGASNVREVLNTILYTLSARSCVEEMDDNVGMGARLLRVAEALPNLPQLVDTPVGRVFGGPEAVSYLLHNSALSYFFYVRDALRAAAPYLSVAQILTMRAVFGSETDTAGAGSLWGAVKQLEQLAEEGSADSETFTSVIGNPGAFQHAGRSLMGQLSALFEVLVGALEWAISGAESSCSVLLPSLQKQLRRSYDSVLVQRVQQIATQATEIFDQIRARKATFKWDTENLCLAVMRFWHMLHRLDKETFDKQAVQTRVGQRYCLTPVSTLSRVTDDLSRAFYLAEAETLLGSNLTPAPHALFSVANAIGAFMDGASPDWGQLNYGNYLLSDLEVGRTLYKSLLMVKSSVQSSYAIMTPTLHTALLQALGDPSQSPNAHSLFGYMQSLYQATDANDMEVAQAASAQALALCDNVLTLFYRGAAAAVLSGGQQRLDELISSGRDNRAVTLLCLPSVLRAVALEDLQESISDTSYTLPKQTVLDLLTVIGRLGGNKSQNNFSGNILCLLSTASGLTIRTRHVGKPTDMRNQIDGASVNTLYGNVNWLRAALHENSLCACPTLADRLIALAETTAHTASTLECFFANLPAVLLQYPSSESTRQAWICVSDFFNEITSTVQEAQSMLRDAAAREGGGDRAMCRADLLVKTAQSIEASVQGLSDRVRSVLPDEVRVASQQPLATRQEELSAEACKSFSSAVEAVLQQVQRCADIVEQSDSVLEELPFWNLPSDNARLIAGLQEQLAACKQAVAGLDDLFPLCVQPGHVRISLGGVMVSVDTLASAARRYADMDGLCCSFSDFLIANAVRLAEKVPEALHSIFSVDPLDALVRDHSLDGLVVGTGTALGQLAEGASGIVSVCDQLGSSACRAYTLIQPLRTLTHGVLALVQRHHDFAFARLGFALEPLVAYQLPSGTIFRCATIPAHVQQLATALADICEAFHGTEGSVVAAVQMAQALSYNPPLIQAVRECAVPLASLHASAERLSASVGQENTVCAACPPLVEPLIALTAHTADLENGLVALEAALQTPRCCADTAEQTEQIVAGLQAVGQQLQDYVAARVVDLQNNAGAELPAKDFIIKFGRGIKALAAAVANLEFAVQQRENNLGQKCCWSEEFWPALEGIKEAVTAFQANLPVTLSVAASKRGDCRWTGHFAQVAPQVDGWTAAFEDLAKTLEPILQHSMDVVPLGVLRSTINRFDALQPTSVQKYAFRLCDAISFFVPFLEQIATSLERLWRLFARVEHNGGHLCNGCSGSGLVQSVQAIESSVRASVVPVRHMLRMFDVSRGYNVAALDRLGVVEYSAQWASADANGDVPFRCSKNPRVFISRVNPSHMPAERDPACFPYFRYQGQQVLWQRGGKIVWPEALCEWNLTDFAPISLLTKIKGITRTVRITHAAVRDVEQSFHGPADC